jgi:hypothetical protein
MHVLQLFFNDKLPLLRTTQSLQDSFSGKCCPSDSSDRTKDKKAVTGKTSLSLQKFDEHKPYILGLESGA